MGHLSKDWKRLSMEVAQVVLVVVVGELDHLVLSTRLHYRYAVSTLILAVAIVSQDMTRTKIFPSQIDVK